jgi:hypothetical protein
VRLEPVIFHSTNFVGFQTQFFFGKKCFLSANLTNFAIALPDFLFQKKRREREREREKPTCLEWSFFSPTIVFHFLGKKTSENSGNLCFSRVNSTHKCCYCFGKIQQIFDTKKLALASQLPTSTIMGEITEYASFHRFRLTKSTTGS